MIPTVTLFCLFLLFSVGKCNTEKVIFVAPEQSAIQPIPKLSDSALHTLSSAKPQVRTYLDVAFPTVSNKKGLQSWYLIEDLSPNQRYEIRVCWAALVSYICP